MRIALIGHGKMGSAVEQLALRRGYRVSHVVERAEAGGFSGDWASETDVLIDFSTASAVPSNVARAVEAGLPIVEGTTGWADRLKEVRQTVLDANGSCLYSSNFSIGVQALFFLARQAAGLFSRLEDYSPYIDERHHSAKKDAPSGTALTLRTILNEAGCADVPVSSLRAGRFPGGHEVGFDSEADTLTLTHTARSRLGFAAGALFAAQWIIGKRGFYDLQEVVFSDRSGK